MFLFVRNWQTVYQRGCTSLPCYWQWMRVLLLHSLSSTCCFCVLDIGHSKRCAVFSHCCFNLHFHDDVENNLILNINGLGIFKRFYLRWGGLFRAGFMSVNPVHHSDLVHRSSAVGLTLCSCQLKIITHL